MTVAYALVLALSAGLFAFVGTWALIALLPRWEAMDAPVERSNHAEPTPRGAGLAVVISALFFLIVCGVSLHMLLAVTMVAAVSFADDLRGQTVKRRLLVQGIAALLAVSTIHQPIFHGALLDTFGMLLVRPMEWAYRTVGADAPDSLDFLPLFVDHLLAIPLLVGFMNLYNFMDGIDEITAVESVSLSLGLIAMVYAQDTLPELLGVDSLVIAGAVAGFWYFNRHPARIFLGDVGSIPLGLMYGTLLLTLASQGEWAAALILPAYYLYDGGLTLLKRLATGASITEAHSDHAYQRAVRSGLTHRQVVSQVLVLNLLLLVLAAVSTFGGIIALGCLGAAYVATMLMTAQLKRARPRLRQEVLPANG